MTNDHAFSNKIALFLNFDSKPGGAERRFARYFASSKLDNLLLVINKAGFNRLREAGVSVSSDKVVEFDYPHSRFSVLNKLNVLYALWRTVWANRIAHVHYPIDPSIYTLVHALIGPVFGVGYSLSMVDSSRVSRRDFGFFQFFVWKYSLRFASKVDFLSQGILENANRILGFHRRRGLVSPCSFTDYSKSSRTDGSQYDFVFISRLVPGKGVDLLIDALIYLKRVGKLEKIGRVGIFGDGPLKPFVIERLQELNCESVRLGYLYDVFEVLVRSKVFLSLQRSENYPSQALLEAMSCGLFVVATDVGETARLVRDELGARIPATPELLAEIMLTIAQDFDSHLARGQHGANFVRGEFSLDRFRSYFDGFLCEASDRD